MTASVMIVVGNIAVSVMPDRLEPRRTKWGRHNFALNTMIIVYNIV